MDTIAFTKMHGLGNDFVVIDARVRPVALTSGQVRAIADRKTGVGCDQLIVIEPPRESLADIFMRIRNADGSEVAACGNATRCVASVIMAENGNGHALIQTSAGLLDAEAADGGLVAVDMGPAYLDWRDIPVAEPVDTLHLDINEGPLRDPVGVGVGNPHCVFFVDDAEGIDLESFGPLVEKHRMFPEYTNVEAVQIIDRAKIRMRVWERGVGITRACGTGACASLVAAARRGLTNRRAEVILDGGSLVIEWMADGHIQMTGPVATSYAGTLNGALLK